MDGKKTINKETVQKPVIKKVVKNETVYTLDENKNLIKKDISTIEKDLQIEDSVEFKISEKRNDLNMNSDMKNLDDSINDVINDGIVEIQAEVMEEEEIKKEKKQKTSKIKKQEVEIPKQEPEVSVKIDKKEPVFTEQYTYKEENTVIIQDKPSTPLILENYNSNKKQYESYLGKNFIIYYNGVELYNSSVSTATITFEDDFFTLFGKNYSYKGFRIKIK